MRNSEQCSCQCHDAWQAIIMMHVLGMQVFIYNLSTSFRVGCLFIFTHQSEHIDAKWVASAWFVLIFLLHSSKDGWCKVVLDGQPNLICNDSSAVAVLCVAAQQLQCLLMNIQQGNGELMTVGLPHLVKHFLTINLINLAILGLTSITTKRQSMLTAL